MLLTKNHLGRKYLALTYVRLKKLDSLKDNLFYIETFSCNFFTKRRMIDDF